ncbi:MAG: phospholipid carrier-dependent glycosyltransferase [Phycisphaerales bacterium]|nr:phospholipid carrier-dependent glycosyltransferase [Phycisphaerales bacterium]
MPLFLGMQIVLIGMVSSAIGALSGAAFVWGHCLALTAATCLVGLNPAPGLQRERGGLVRASRARWPASACGGRRHIASTMVCVIVLGLTLVVAIKTESPANFDSQTYRLPRLAFWLEAGSVSQVNTNNARINLMPYHDALLVGWTYALLGTDRFVHLSSWFFGAGLMALAHALARATGLSRKFAPLAPLILTGAPMFAVQLGGVQSDIFAAYFTSAAVLSAIRWIRSGAPQWLILSAVALGLGVGTKQTVLLVLPALAVIALPLLRANPPLTTLRRFGALTAATALGVAVFGSWSYLNNYRWYGHPLGQRETRVSEGVKDRSFHGFRWRLKRELFIHLSPMPAPIWAVPALAAFRDALFAKSATGWWLSRAFEYEWIELLNRGGVLNHDVTGFGIMLSLIFCAALLASWPGRRAPPARWLAVAMLWSGVVLLLTITAAIEFMTTNGRFLLIAAPFGAVGIAAVARRIRRPLFRASIAAAITLVSAASAFMAIGYHIQQPLFGLTDSALASYGREALVERGDTVGLIAGADGPIWEFMTPGRDRRFISLGDADYPTGDEEIRNLMRERGLTTLVADAATQHEGAIPGTLSQYHTWFSFVPGKGMRRIFVSRRLPAATIVQTAGIIRAEGEVTFEPVDGVRASRWSYDPLPRRAYLEFAADAAAIEFCVEAFEATAAIIEIQTSNARRHAVDVSISNREVATSPPRPDGSARMAIRLAPGENRIRVALRGESWPDVNVVVSGDNPALERIAVIAMR